MGKPDKKALALSLVFPAAVFLWGAARLITDLLFAGGIDAFKGIGAVRFTYVPAIPGGILAALLTMIFKIDTKRYFVKRLVVVAIVCVIHRVILSIITAPMIIITLAGIIGVIYQVMRVQDDDTTGGERAVLMLSDPLIYWSVYWAAIQLVLDI